MTKLTNIIIFEGTNIAYPTTELVEGPDGTFYGATSGGGLYADGTIFRMKLTGQLTVLFSFDDSSSSGSDPNPLTLGRDGNLYGSTSTGGFNQGAIFRILIPPKLSSTAIGNQMVLSWSTNNLGFNLQSTTELNSSNWLEITNTPVVFGRQYWVTNPISGGSHFFRLRK